MSTERQNYQRGTIAVLRSDIQDEFNGQILAGQEFSIEGYWEDVMGRSWMSCYGNPACILYAVRSAVSGLPIDDEVLYGHVGDYGHLIHMSEIDYIK